MDFKTFVFASCVFTLSLLGSTHARLSCYTCHYDPFKLYDDDPTTLPGSEACGLDFVASGSGVERTECDEGAVACSFINFYGYNLAGAYRGCAYELCQEGCLKGSGITSCHHCCTEDNCNAAAKLCAAPALLLAAVIYMLHALIL